MVAGESATGRDFDLQGVRADADDAGDRGQVALKQPCGIRTRPVWSCARSRSTVAASLGEARSQRTDHRRHERYADGRKRMTRRLVRRASGKDV